MDKRTVALHWLAGACASMLFLFPGLFLGEVPLYRDFLVLVLPLRLHAAEAVRAGEIPLWTSQLFLGAPFLANYQSAVFYPPSAILWLMPSAAGLTCFLAFHLTIAIFGTSRYLVRHLGLEPGAGFFAGIVFAFGGFLSSLLALTNQFTAAAWIPWILAAADDVRSNRRGAGKCLAVLLAVQVLAGAAEVVVLTQVILATTWLRAGWPGLAAITRATIAGVLAIGLTAFQWLPTIDYVRSSDRTGGLPLRTVLAESLSPESVQQALLPNVFHEGAPDFTAEGGVPLVASVYLGIAPLICALVGLSVPAAHSWVLLGGIGILLGLGGATPVLPFLYEIAPRVVGSFRYPIKFFLLTHLAFSVLAGIGLTAALRKRGIGFSCVAAGTATAALVIAAAVLLTPEAMLGALDYELREGLDPGVYAEIGSRVAGRGIRSVGFAVASLLVWWLVSRRRAWSLLGPALAVLAVVDLQGVHRPLLGFVPGAALGTPDPALALGLAPGNRVFHGCVAGFGCLPQGANGIGRWSGSLRVGEPVVERAAALWHAAAPNLSMLSGVTAVGGNDGLVTDQQGALFALLERLPRPRAVQLLGALGVSAIVMADGERDGSTTVLRPPQVAPESYLALRENGASSLRTALERLADPSFRPGEDAVTAGEPGGTRELGRGAILESTRERGTVRSRIWLEGEGLWVVNDSWSADWVGSVDGEPAEILRVNGIARGLRAPPGEHVLEMSYRPQSFRRGLAVSAIALALLFVTVVVDRFDRRSP